MTLEFFSPKALILTLNQSGQGNDSNRILYSFLCVLHWDFPGCGLGWLLLSQELLKMKFLVV